MFHTLNRGLVKRALQRRPNRQKYKLFAANDYPWHFTEMYIHRTSHSSKKTGRRGCTFAILLQIGNGSLSYEPVTSEAVKRILQYISIGVFWRSSKKYWSVPRQWNENDPQNKAWMRHLLYLSNGLIPKRPYLRKKKDLDRWRTNKICYCTTRHPQWTRRGVWECPTCNNKLEKLIWKR